MAVPRVKYDEPAAVLLFSDKRKGLLCEKQKLSVPLVRQAPMKKR